MILSDGHAVYLLLTRFTTLTLIQWNNLVYMTHTDRQNNKPELQFLYIDVMSSPKVMLMSIFLEIFHFFSRWYCSTCTERIASSSCFVRLRNKLSKWRLTKWVTRWLTGLESKEKIYIYFSDNIHLILWMTGTSLCLQASENDSNKTNTKTVKLFMGHK